MRQTRDEFRASNPEGSRGFESPSLQRSVNDFRSFSSLRGAADKAKRVKAQADLSEIKTALDRFYLDNGYYPTTDQGLNALVSLPTNGRVPNNYENGGYIERLPHDPWGNPYSYASDGNIYQLRSLGPSGVEGADNTRGGSFSLTSSRSPF